MMCGFAGTPPATLIPDTASFITVTGIAARRVGILTGLLFIVVAFVPKSIAPLLAIPNPVIGGLLFTLGALVFIQGFKIVFQDGIDPSKAIIVGVSLWLGIAFQGNMVFTDYFSGALHILSSSGVIVGGMSVLLLTTFMWLTSPRQKKLNVRLDLSSTSELSTTFSPNSRGNFDGLTLPRPGFAPLVRRRWRPWLIYTTRLKQTQRETC